MSIENPLQNTGSMLSLPSTDFPSLYQNQISGNDFFLLQLPPSLKYSDIVENSSRILIQDTVNDDDKLVQCRFVIEEKGISYDLIKVHTSNTYVLVPPIIDEINTITTIHTTIRHANKKAKLDIDNDLYINNKIRNFPSRLLRESNTFFLDCCQPSSRECSSRQQKILRLLCNIHPDGLLLSSIATQLSCSQLEVKSCISSLNSIYRTSCPIPYYVYLHPHRQKKAITSLIDTLTEWDGANDYAHHIKDKPFLENYVLRSNLPNEILLNVFQTYICGKSIHSTSLNTKKIASSLVHQLFQSRTSWEYRSLMEKWNLLIPGVGEKYEPKYTWLQGIALIGKDMNLISKKIEDSYVHAKYFPTNQLPKDLNKKIDILYNIRHQWKIKDIMPYVEEYFSGIDIESIEAFLESFAKKVTRLPTEDVWYKKN